MIDKIHFKLLEMIYSQRSGKHHIILKEIRLISLVWTDEVVTYPLDYRLYDPDDDEKTKNEHFRDMIQTAISRGFSPSLVLFDS